MALYFTFYFFAFHIKEDGQRQLTSTFNQVSEGMINVDLLPSSVDQLTAAFTQKSVIMVHETNI